MTFSKESPLRDYTVKPPWPIFELFVPRSMGHIYVTVTWVRLHFPHVDSNSCIFVMTLSHFGHIRAMVQLDYEYMPETSINRIFCFRGHNFEVLKTFESMISKTTSPLFFFWNAFFCYNCILGGKVQRCRQKWHWFIYSLHSKLSFISETMTIPW